MLKNQYLALGIMSGTSLDGVDLALCRFILNQGKWTYDVMAATTRPYSGSWLEKLSFTSLSAEDLLKLDHDYGNLLGFEIRDFLKQVGETPDFIASHGHTLYHQPENGFTFQLGNGPEIFASTQIPVVCDFRRQDIALGGQGAPLVPMGDHLLFGDFDACLNLGGFANISLLRNDHRIAFDICPVNFVLNRFAKGLGYSFDESGRLAASSHPAPELLSQWNSLNFYHQPPPKSLGAEWVESNFLPLIADRYNSRKKIATATAHAAEQIARVLNEYKVEDCLVTGGGAYNTFLVDSIRKKTHCELILPDSETIEFKEAVIFAFLGLLRYRKEVNILSSVTGSAYDHSSGIVYDFQKRN